MAILRVPTVTATESKVQLIKGFLPHRSEQKESEAKKKWIIRVLALVNADFHEGKVSGYLSRKVYPGHFFDIFAVDDKGDKSSQAELSAAGKGQRTEEDAPKADREGRR